MKKSLLIILFILYIHSSYGQVNCLIYPEGSAERKACIISNEAVTYKQGSRESQLLFDRAIAIGPKFDWAYYEKSVPFFKRGFLLEGIEILNNAIELNPLDYLCYRAYWYWQYGNYEMCIQDLETYYNMPKAYLQMTPGGEKDMRIILGLAYAKTGNYKKGIETITDCIKNNLSEDFVGLSDYHSLGILYVKNRQYDKAIEAFDLQIEMNADLAELYYYLGLAYKGKSNTIEAQEQFKKALIKINDPNRFYNTNAGFLVYITDIEQEIDK